MILFGAAVLATFVATPGYILAAERLGWVDQPWGRKRHERATATMGGLVIFAVVFTGAFVALSLENRVGEMLREKEFFLYALMSCTFCMILLGVIDDRHTIRPRVKLMVQAVVAFAAVSMGFRVEAVTFPLFESVQIPAVAGYFLSFAWIIGITNAVNLTDGLDGLAVGICLLASGVNALVAIWLGNYYMSVMMVLLAGALLGFLRYNFHPARVFLGDTGSLALGMYLALASLHSAQKSHTAVLILVPLFALGYPIFDTLLAIARRWMRGQPLFSSDRDHIHHRLLDRSRSPSIAAIQIYVACFVLSVFCIAAAAANHFIVGVAIAGVAIMAVFSARVLGYLEWGGWAARWSGRGETRILHAAATLARLKIRQAHDQSQLLQSLAIAAREMGCVHIELKRGEDRISWTDPRPDDVARGFSLNDDAAAAISDNPVNVPATADGAPEAPPTSDTVGSPQEEEIVLTSSMFEVPVDDETTIRFTFTGQVELNEERSQILEELTRELGERLT